MSRVLILSSDTIMPEFHSIEGFSVEKSYYYRKCPEIDRFVKKAYCYTMDISANKLALLELKKYLTKNTETVRYKIYYAYMYTLENK